MMHYLIVLTVVMLSVAVSIPTGPAMCAAETSAAPDTGEGEGQTHRAAPIGSYGGIMNPDISAIVDSWALLTDDRSVEERNTLFIKETELAFQSYLYPSIRGDFIAAMHNEAGSWHIHPEEAVVTFLDLPLDLQARAGRSLIRFGKLNAIHSHHWPFASEPLVLRNFLGEHSWFDDGVEVSWLVPNPWMLYVKTSLGTWSGAGSAEEHEDGGEAEEPRVHAGGIEWHGKVSTGRASIDVPFGALSNVTGGYSIAWDESGRTRLHGFDLSVTYRRPVSYRRVKWQSELFLANNVEAREADPFGFYSMVVLTLNKYYECGARFDRSEYLEHAGDLSAAAAPRDYEWGLSGFLTYYFTHSLYLRVEYVHQVDWFDRDVSVVIAQLVWGLGPHAHRLED
jgi:hypothetical protein